MTRSSGGVGKVRFAAVLWLVALAFARPASADSTTPSEDVVGVSVDALRGSRFVTLQERPFAFLNDPSTPTKGTASVAYVVGVASGMNADRPLPASVSTAGLSDGFAVSYGVSDRFAPFVSATLAESSAAHVRAGAALQLTRPAAPLRVTVTGAVLREGTTGAGGAALSVSASLDQGPVRVAADVRGEKVFVAGRDSVDFVALAGVSYRLTSWMRVGAEYVGQDLEEAFGGEAEGGARHAIGPSLAFDLDGRRYQVTVASGFGIGPGSPAALVRGGLAFNF